VKIGFAINDIQTEQPGYSTVRLAMAAHNRGHEAWLIPVGNFAYDKDERISARALGAGRAAYKQGASYLADVQGKKSRAERISVTDLDVLMLRNDPANDANRTWAQSAGVIFGRSAMRQGVIVLNDPDALAGAMNKMYFQQFPEEVRPRTIITRDRDELKAFVKEEGGYAVLKPLQGSGGQGVFLVKPDDLSNMNQMIEAVSRDGYVIGQEYLPDAVNGDIRLFVMNGQPLKHKGKYAAFRRVRSGEDMRSNIHAGGKLAQAVITPEHLRLVEIVRPKLVLDGMFLVGLDIVGDKLMEINVFSPGGLGSAQKLEKVNFAHGVVQALERKVDYMGYYKRNFDNVEMATL
jgi:glutathione synthase